MANPKKGRKIIAIRGRRQHPISTFGRLSVQGGPGACARSGQTLPQGCHPAERRLKIVGSTGGKGGVCGTCKDSRGLRDEELLDCAQRSRVEEATHWTVRAGKPPVF